VLLSEVIESLSPRDGEIFIDATFGAGGYTRALLKAADCSVIAIDRDPTAVAGAQKLCAEFPGRLTISEAPFSALDAIAEEQGFDRVDGVVLDIGVSSMQLNEAQRGFSFQADGPLDMRMSGAASDAGPSAADVINQADDGQLADILFRLGEERSARAIARAIVARRRQQPFTRTGELASLVARVLGRERIAGRHAATRTFQALRMYVNDELFELNAGLAAAERVLAPGGRLLVVTFHSLEDRLAKQFLKRRAEPEAHGSRHLPPQTSGRPAPSFRFVNHRPLSPTEEEVAANPRARSAKLRWAVRTDAPAWPPDELDPAIPRLGA
jgi:16S rRNA (cytosine1402-N4)-methyltransferase